MTKKILLLIIIFTGLAVASIRKMPDKVDYGVSFSVLHARELGLDWKMVYNALIDDLGVRQFRLSAHWPITEPKNDVFNFSELDYQITRAENHGASIILAVGRRLPGWPECHEPEWTEKLSKEEKREELLEYISRVVNLYKNSPAISHWQIENEPFLTGFAKRQCQDFSDKEFLKEEIALVRSLDPNRPILVTDSGEIGFWYDAYNLGDSFGTSLYLYVWNQKIGPFRYPITPAFFRIKRNIIELIYGKKDSLLIELSLEPWLLQPIKDTPIETSLSRMDIDKFNKIIKFAQKTGFEVQYLWGAEWWYYMKINNHLEFWKRARELF
ncbi:MAG: beta-galactosidase [Patescibacteria group bacterium]